jgi:hypothetical protein
MPPPSVRTVILLSGVLTILLYVLFYLGIFFFLHHTLQQTLTSILPASLCHRLDELRNRELLTLKLDA